MRRMRMRCAKARCILRVRVCRDALMDGRHCPGFTGFPGRGPHHVFEHDGRRLALCREEDGEPAAFKALIEEIDVRGHPITLDALHSTTEIEQRIVDMHGADHLFTIGKGCPDTFEALDEVDRKATATGTFAEDTDKTHGRIERRTIHVVSPLDGALAFKTARQAFRIIRDRTIEVAYGITSRSMGSPCPPFDLDSTCPIIPRGRLFRCQSRRRQFCKRLVLTC